LTALDNALMETIIGLYKTECIRTSVFHHSPYNPTFINLVRG
jgi:hypothetical protein